MNREYVNNFKRVNKATARKLYDEGKSFLMVACNLRPEYGIFIDGMRGREENQSFDVIYNAYCYYNCVNNETGRYPAFYINP